MSLVTDYKGKIVLCVSKWSSAEGKTGKVVAVDRQGWIDVKFPDDDMTWPMREHEVKVIDEESKL